MLDHAVHTDQATIQQIYDVRRTIEMRTVALAALRRLDAEAQEIASHAAGMRESFLRPEQAMEHDIAFHAAIAVMSRNPLFALIVGSLRVITRQTWRIGWTVDYPTINVSPASRATNASPRQSLSGLVRGRGRNGRAFR